MKELCKARKRAPGMGGDHVCGLPKGHKGKHRCAYGMYASVGCKEQWEKVK